MKNKKIKVHGLIEMYLTDQKTGVKKKIYEHENSIYTEFYAALAESLDNGRDNALSDLFVTCVTQPPNYKDGIVLLWDIDTDPEAGELEYFYSLKTTLSEPSSNQFRATGLYDAGVAIDVISLDLGLLWVGGGQGGAFDELQIATHQPAGVSIPISTNYTVVWTLTFTVH